MVKLTVEALPVGARVELCVQYSVGEEEWWDSNGGVNYQIECRDISKELVNRPTLVQSKFSLSHIPDPFSP